MDDQHITPGYTELFRLACANGLQELDVNVLQIPSDANQQHAVVVASARTARGFFRAVGEAHRSTLPEQQRYEVLRVAELRAKVAVLAESVGVPRDAASSTVKASEATGARNASPDAAVPVSSASSASTAEATPVATTSTVYAGGAKPVSAATAGHMDEIPAEIPGPDPVRPASQPAPAAPTSSVEEQARTAMRPPVKVVASAASGEALKPEVVTQLLKMTRHKAMLEGGDTSEEEAERKLDSFFQRKFGHSMAEATRMEGQWVVQRLASDLAKLNTEHPDAARTGS